MLHVDVMDGMFVPNISLGIPVLAGLAKEVRAFYDVHLMIERPLDYVPQFVKAGANAVTFHLEAKSDVRQTLRAIRAQGVLAGLSIKPATSPEAVLPYLDELDLVLVMSVEPGFRRPEIHAAGAGQAALSAQDAAAAAWKREAYSGGGRRHQ